MSGEPSPGHIAGSHSTSWPELIHVGVVKLYADDPVAPGSWAKLPPGVVGR
jgi:hypothetical protein